MEGIQGFYASCGPLETPRRECFLSRRTSHEWLTATFGWQNLGTLTHFVISLAGCIIGHKLAGLVASHASMNHSTMISSPITAIFKMENCWYEGEKTSSYGQLQPSSHKLKFPGVSPLPLSPASMWTVCTNDGSWMFF